MKKYKEQNDFALHSVWKEVFTFLSFFQGFWFKCFCEEGGNQQLLWLQIITQCLLRRLWGARMRRKGRREQAGREGAGEAAGFPSSSPSQRQKQAEAPLTLSTHLPQRGHSMAFLRSPVSVGVSISNLQNKALSWRIPSRGNSFSLIFLSKRSGK